MTTGSTDAATAPAGGSADTTPTPTAASVTLTATPISEEGPGDPVKGGVFNYGTLGNVDYGNLDMTTTTGTSNEA